MRTAFATKVMACLKASGSLNERTSLLAVCAGDAEKNLFLVSGLSDATLTSLDPVMLSDAMSPYKASLADVRKLPFANGAFDWVFVSDGLHHCDSPHAALVEMYRVSRKGVIVFESRDNLLIRLAVACGLTEQYEISAVADNRGECAGVNYTSVPNYVYRWTERDFEKAITCADPTGKPSFRYFYGFNAPVRSYSGIKALIYTTAVLAGKVFACLFKKQSNSFCMVAFKPTELFPWLERTAEGVVRFRKGH